MPLLAFICMGAAKTPPAFRAHMNGSIEITEFTYDLAGNGKSQILQTQGAIKLVKQGAAGTPGPVAFSRIDHAGLVLSLRSAPRMCSPIT